MGCLLSQLTTKRNNKTIKFRTLRMVHSLKCRYSTKKVSSHFVPHSESFKVPTSSSHSFQQKGSQKPPPPNLNVKVGICQVYNRILRQVILFLSEQSFIRNENSRHCPKPLLPACDPKKTDDWHPSSILAKKTSQDFQGTCKDIDMCSCISFIICPPLSTQVLENPSSEGIKQSTH